MRLSPEQLLGAIHALALAEWALSLTQQLRRPRLPRRPGGRPLTYPDSGILLMAVVQTAWRKSYEQMVDWVATNETLALALGFTQRTLEGKLHTISKSQCWERRQALGVLPFLFFFLALVAQLIRLGAITGKELIVALDPAESLEQGRSRRSLAAIRRESACVRLQGAYRAV